MTSSPSSSAGTDFWLAALEISWQQLGNSGALLRKGSREKQEAQPKGRWRGAYAVEDAA
eukprot:CAMPEP_0117038850 /NCGR_PEP_ID=MMETSP0472-20121206/27299_1 /TAXON_ID=693140 ORGANISM="Tiarina fusus, Strain LIS" /NCGR_SAMPLE_ID=MMETSP0472 /ASSEMBLY_ACC=CAM_ASM_000603 /LENGTH=58 /DNA_ID=CAMNT_0004749169 /DNA_START=127 /DNA_END=300 /DNA_ORIENTATION=-